MAGWIKKYYPDAQAEYTLINRGHKKIDVDIRELQEQLQSLYELDLTQDERQYLAAQGIPYPHGQHAISFDVSKVKDDIHVKVFGSWHAATMMETFVMSIINELMNRDIQPTLHGRAALKGKLAVLSAIPEITVSDFGTRRRFSRDWHEHVIQQAHDVIKSTSNLWLAKQYGLKPVGTMAHEIFMGVAALYDHSQVSLRGTQQVVLQQWFEHYGDKYATALTDTFGSKAFFCDWTAEQAVQWNGYRQDSGDPIQFADLVVYSHRNRVLPLSNKQIVFSDNLNLNTILVLQHKYENIFKPVFGWGTNLTNDMGLSPPQIVVKLTKLNGHETVKLGDGIGKVLGSDKAVAQYQKAFEPDLKALWGKIYNIRG